MKNKKILFYPTSSTSAELVDPPSPAIKNIPQWFKDIPRYMTKDNTFKFENGTNNLSVKSCLPVLDGFTAGYFILLDRDIQISRNENNDIFIEWGRVDESINNAVITRPPTNSVDFNPCGWENLEGYDELQFNWIPFWCIKTPPGYSSILMHPINRIDLPFYTLGGVVDTDGWGDAGNHPFLLKKNWTGIIPAGTPIIQVFPFKRENWDSHADKTMTMEYNKKISNRNKKFKDYYKKNFWQTKKYN